MLPERDPLSFFFLLSDYAVLESSGHTWLIRNLWRTNVFARRGASVKTSSLCQASLFPSPREPKSGVAVLWVFTSGVILSVVTGSYFLSLSSPTLYPFLTRKGHRVNTQGETSRGIVNRKHRKVYTCGNPSSFLCCARGCYRLFTRASLEHNLFPPRWLFDASFLPGFFFQNSFGCNFESFRFQSAPTGGDRLDHLIRFFFRFRRCPIRFVC